MRSYRHEARREPIGKIYGSRLWDYRVQALSLRPRVEIDGQIVLCGEDVRVAQ